MASGGEEKTEEPTAKKMSDARKKGNIPKSKDLAAAMLFLAGLTVLKYLGPWMAYRVCDFFEKMIRVDMPALDVPEKKEIIPYAIDWFLWLGMLLGPFLIIVAAAAFLVHYYQVGFLVATEQLKIDFKKLNPISGFKRIFSMRNVVMLIMNVAKLAVIMGVAWSTVISEVQYAVGMVEMETAGMLIYATDEVIALAQKLAILLAVLGFADFQYQKWKHHKDLKMTKQEVKEEFKQMDGDPLIKQKRRQKQMEMAQQRMMAEVPQAEVVVRNPTHYAVAISYKPGMPAPVVVAKGKDKMAEKIIEAARENRVPLVENPPLARELYRKVEIGDAIPEELFAAVAEILTSVMDADKKRKMMESLAGQPVAA